MTFSLARVIARPAFPYVSVAMRADAYLKKYAHCSAFPRWMISPSHLKKSLCLSYLL
jgi:hypothetical protein